MSIRSTLEDVERELQALPADQRAIYTDKIRSVISIGLGIDTMPETLKDALQGAFMTIMARAPLGGDRLMAKVREELPHLPAIRAICEGLIR